MDFNSCLGNPCSANGACIDAGLAVGYIHTRLDGVDIKEAPNGPTCVEDDSVGDKVNIHRLVESRWARRFV